MKFYSTNNKTNLVDFKEAVLTGIAKDGGLYLPTKIPKFDKTFFKSLSSLSLQEISFNIAKKFIKDIDENDLQSIITQSINFDAPLINLSDDISILELFHGPTLAFKDFGARFLAYIFSYYNKSENKESLILVATSGDTGSAVANAFNEVGSIKVGLLYPSNKISSIQEQQLTTIGGEVQAFEVDGNFDDCQSVVKKALMDVDLIHKFNLSSANSINIARLLPQIFYYFYAIAQSNDISKPNIFSVPCGNFGNLTAGIIAWKMGLPVDRFIAAINSNKSFINYLETGEVVPQNSIKTLSNAMDVGYPSNLARIGAIFNDEINMVKKQINSVSISDKLTIAGIKKVKNQFNYLIDPHGAVGYQAAAYFDFKKCNNIILETAHPAKFIDVMEKVLNEKIKIPDRLMKSLKKPKKSIKISSNYKEFKSQLLNLLN